MAAHRSAARGRGAVRVHQHVIYSTVRRVFFVAWRINEVFQVYRQIRGRSTIVQHDLVRHDPRRRREMLYDGSRV